MVPGWGQVPGLCGHKGGRAGMPGLHLRTDHVFRLGGSLALPRGALWGLNAVDDTSAVVGFRVVLEQGSVGSDS